MRINRKDLASGAVFIAVGLFYLVYTLRTLSIGRTLNMGPGYFPMVLSGLLMVIGAIIAIRSLAMTAETPFGPVPWRAIVMVTLSIVLFAVFLGDIGLFPAVMCTAMAACLASSQITPPRGLAISLGIAVFCWLVFKAGVGLPVPTFGRWFEATPLMAVEPALLSAIHAIVALPGALIEFFGRR